MAGLLVSTRASAADAKTEIKTAHASALKLRTFIEVFPSLGLLIKRQSMAEDRCPEKISIERRFAYRAAAPSGSVASGTRDQNTPLFDCVEIGWKPDRVARHKNFKRPIRHRAHPGVERDLPVKISLARGLRRNVLLRCSINNHGAKI